MEDRGIFLKIVVYNILIDHMCKSGKLEDARKIFSCLPAKGLKPDVKAYTTMISGLCKESLLDEAEELLLSMDANGCSPNAVTHKIILRGFLNRGDRLKVMVYQQEMIDRNFLPDASTMSVLVYVLTLDAEECEMFKMIQKLFSRDK